MQRAPACRRQDLQRPGPAEARQGAAAGEDHRRAGLHGPEGPAADLQAGAARRSGRRPGPACASCPALVERDRAPSVAPRMEVSLDRKAARSRQRASESFDSFDPLRTARCGRPPYQAYGADHVRLRQVLHLLHRAERPRAGAKPPGRRDRRRSPPTGRRRLPAKSRSSARPSTAIATRAAARPLRLADLLGTIARHRRPAADSSSSRTIPRT